MNFINTTGVSGPIDAMGQVPAYSNFPKNNPQKKKKKSNRGLNYKGTMNVGLTLLLLCVFYSLVARFELPFNHVYVA